MDETKLKIGYVLWHDKLLEIASKLRRILVVEKNVFLLRTFGLMIMNIMLAYTYLPCYVRIAHAFS